MQKSARTSRLAILIFLIVLLATGVSACAPSAPPDPTAPAYLVRYFTDDTEYHSETVPQGSVATLPPTPVKDGFLFAGWAVLYPRPTFSVLCRRLSRCRHCPLRLLL